MRFFIVVAVFACLVCPVFAQNANQQRMSALSDSMGRTISQSNDNLADFNTQLKDNSDTRIYGSYRVKYEYLVKALQESELKMNQLFRSNDRIAYIEEERDHYESLIKQLESTKSEYDNFVRGVR